MPIREVSDRFYGPQDTKYSEMGQGIADSIFGGIEKRRQEQQLGEGIRAVYETMYPQFRTMSPEDQDRLVSGVARVAGSKEFGPAMGVMGGFQQRADTEAGRLRGEQQQQKIGGAWAPIIDAVRQKAGADMPAVADWGTAVSGMDPNNIAGLFMNLLRSSTQREGMAQDADQFEKSLAQRKAEASAPRPTAASARQSTSGRMAALKSAETQIMNVLSKLEDPSADPPMGATQERIINLREQLTEIRRQMSALDTGGTQQPSESTGEQGTIPDNSNDPLGILD